MNIKFRYTEEAVELTSFRDFLQGAKDCAAGLTCEPDCSESYLQGYGLQYQIEQTQTWRSGYEH